MFQSSDYMSGSDDSSTSTLSLVSRHVGQLDCSLRESIQSYQRLSEKVAVLAERVDILTSRIALLTERIGALEEAVGSDREVLQRLNTRVGDLEEDSRTFESHLEAVTDQVHDLRGRVGALEFLETLD